MSHVKTQPGRCMGTPGDPLERHSFIWVRRRQQFKLLGDEKDRKEGQEGVKLGPTLALVE